MLDQISAIADLVARFLDNRAKEREKQVLAPCFTFEQRVIPGGDKRATSKWTQMHDNGFFILRIRVVSAPQRWILRYVEASPNAQIANKLTDSNGRWVGGQRTGTVSHGRKECFYVIEAGTHDLFDLLIKVVIPDKTTIRLRLEGIDGTERTLKIQHEQWRWMEREALQSPPSGGS